MKVNGERGGERERLVVTERERQRERDIERDGEEKRSREGRNEKYLSFIESFPLIQEHKVSCNTSSEHKRNWN